MNGNNRDILQKVFQMLQSDQRQGQGQQGLNMANITRMGVNTGIASLAGIFGGPLGAIIGPLASALLTPNQSNSSSCLTPNQSRQSGLLSPNPQSRGQGQSLGQGLGLAEMVDNALNEDQRGQLAAILRQLVGNGRTMSPDMRDQVIHIILSYLQQNGRGGGSGNHKPDGNSDKKGRGRCRSCNC